MLNKTKFYGKSFYRAAGFGPIVHPIQGRIQVLGGAPSSSLQLPSRAGFNPGGPYLEIVNISGGSQPLKDESGTTILTMANNTISRVMLTPTRWYATSKTINTGSTASSSGGRSNPIGTLATGITPPTTGAYTDPCPGGGTIPPQPPVVDRCTPGVGCRTFYRLRWIWPELTAIGPNWNEINNTIATVMRDPTAIAPNVEWNGWQVTYDSAGNPTRHYFQLFPVLDVSFCVTGWNINMTNIGGYVISFHATSAPQGCPLVGRYVNYFHGTPATDFMDVF